LLAFGAIAHGDTPSRASILANHGAISSTPASLTPCLSAQCFSVFGGVR
jgi:hypothetical protein